MRRTWVILIMTVSMIALFCGCQKCEYHWDRQEEIVKEATCTEDGLLKWTCEDCGYSEEEIIEGEHDFQQDSVLVSPTCETEGLEIVKCTKCGETKEDNMGKRSHERVNFTCINCGDLKELTDYDVSIGDDQWDVRRAWGEPLDIDKSTDAYFGTQETWWYKYNGKTVMVDFDENGNVEYLSIV